MLALLEKSISELDTKGINEGSSFNEVARVIGYENNNSYSSLQCVNEFIDKEINKNISGSSFDKKYISKLKSRLLIGFYIKKNNDKKNVLSYFLKIIDLTRQVDFYTDDFYKWKLIVQLIYFRTCLDKYDPTDYIDLINHKEKSIAASYLFLKKKKYHLELKDDGVYLDQDEQKKICSHINNRLSRLGLKSMLFVLKLIDDKYNFDLNRFNFNRLSESPIIPYGYLFKCAMRNLNEKKQKNNETKIFYEAVELSINYTTILNVQEYSIYETMFQSSDTILEAIINTVLNDQIYSIAQFNPNHIVRLIEKLYLGIDEKKYNLEWSVFNFIEISKSIIRLSNVNSPTKITVKTIFSFCNTPYMVKAYKVLMIIENLKKK